MLTTSTPAPMAVSVIIPALDAAETIGTQLQALTVQDTRAPFEVVVVDNGSSDDTVAISRSYQGQLAHLRIIHCPTAGTSAARNAGAAAATGNKLLFCDADDEVAPGWVGAMAAALDRHDAVGGAIENERLSPGRPAHLPRHPATLPVVAGFLPRALTANLGVRRNAFEAVGGFTENYTYGSDDTEFSWRLQRHGHELAHAPDAVVHYRHRDSLWAVARKAFRTAQSRGRLFHQFRADGMPRPRLAGAVLRWAQLILAVPGLPVSTRLRWWWADAAGAAVGRIAGSIRYRVPYL